MSNESNKTWAGLWGLLAIVLTLFWIFKINWISGIAYALGFSFLKRFVIKGTVAKFIAFTPEYSDPEIAASKLSSRLNRNLFICTLLQFFVLLVAISANTNNGSFNLQPERSKQYPLSPRESGSPQPELEKIQPPGSVVASLPSNPFFQERIWTDRQGRQLTAELIDVRTNQDGALWGKFMRTNGDTFTFEINKLSNSDINLLRDWLKNQ